MNDSKPPQMRTSPTDEDPKSPATSKTAQNQDSDPLMALVGTWTYGDADTYIREMREGWEDRE